MNRRDLFRGVGAMTLMAAMPAPLLAAVEYTESANRLLSAQEITREALRILSRRLLVGGSIRASASAGMEGRTVIGDTIRVRLPARYLASRGLAIE